MPEMTLERANAAMPFAALMGIRFTSLGPDLVTAEMKVRDDLCTANAIAHGGALMTLADAAGAAATFVNLPAGAGTTTIESKTNMIAAAKAGETVRATSVPIHRGRRTQVWQTRIETVSGTLIAVTTQTQMTLS